MHHGREVKRIPWVMTKRGITTIVYSRPSNKSTVTEQENGESLEKEVLSPRNISESNRFPYVFDHKFFSL